MEVFLCKITKRNITPKIDAIIEANSGKKLAVVDVPVLYENGLEDYFDKVLAVVSNRCEQIKRICARDNLTLEEAAQRLNMQLDNAFFVEHADYVIYNYDKKLKVLEEEAKAIYKNILGRK